MNWTVLADILLVSLNGAFETENMKHEPEHETNKYVPFYFSMLLYQPEGHQLRLCRLQSVTSWVMLGVLTF